MEIVSRFKGALWGQLIGDAVALGSHWIYAQEELKRQFPEGIRGFETPKVGHYHAGKVSGDTTHYGEGCRLLLQSIAEKKRFDMEDFSKRFLFFFGSPFYKGYVDAATRGTLDNMRKKLCPTGADDDEMATATRLAPLVVFCFGKEELLQKVKELTLCTQNHPKVVACMETNALILSDLLQGKGLMEAFERRTGDPLIGLKIREAMDAKVPDAFEATKKFGLSCHLQEAFPSSVSIALLYGDSFEKALLANAEAGGDSAGRGGMLGAWLGALHGIEGIPERWLMQLRGKESIAYWIEELLAAR